MRKIMVTLLALLATAGLVYTGLRFPAGNRDTTPESPALVRVRITGQDAAVWSWLRKQARQYEKDTGVRVYLRAISERDTQGSEADTPYDLLISTEGEMIIALHGYALFARDDAGNYTTPFPTSLLFSPPSPTPGPSPTPAPTPDISRFRAILASEEMLNAIPGAIRSGSPLQDFIDGKGDAAILTAEQAGKLSFPVSACPLPKGKSGVPVWVKAATVEGDALFHALLSEPAQRALSDHGLYSPVLPLYQGNDTIWAMIENSL